MLVTGAAGFIGSHFVLRHKERAPDDAIVVLDALSHGSDERFLDPVKDRIRFVRGDITDVVLVTQIVAKYGIDTIVNFAAQTHVDRSIESSAPFLHSNVLGVQALIEVCRAHPDVRLLHISTDEVYGDIADDDPPRVISDPLFPSSPYAASKAAGDLLLMAAMRTYGIRVCVTRCTNNYGPHQAAEKFIPTVIRCALRNEPVPIYATGRNKRDWLFVTDHCDALETVLRTDWAFWDATVPGVYAGQPKGTGHFFNISANDEQENITVAKMILDLLGKPHSLLSFVTDRPGHDWRYSIDSRAIRTLGWMPMIPLEEGLKQTVAWFRARHP